MPDQTFVDYWSLKEPAWDTWRAKRRLPLWQAAALACNIDPSHFQPFGPVEAESIDGMFTPAPQELKDLLALANGAVGGGSLKLFEKDAANLIRSTVDLAGFATWLRFQGHRVPPEFPWAAQAPAIAAATTATPVLKRSALVKRYESQWRTVESDLRHSNENGLAAAAKTAQRGMWREDDAIAWAKQHGKVLTQAAPVASHFPSAYPSTKHVLRDED